MRDPARDVTVTPLDPSLPPLVLAVATDAGRREARVLAASALRSGGELRFLGAGAGGSYGHDWKLRLVEAELLKVEARRLVVVVDGYDVILTPALRNAAALFESFGAPVVAAAELECWPDEAFCDSYDDGGPHLNSGARGAERISQ